MTADIRGQLQTGCKFIKDETGIQTRTYDMTLSDVQWGYLQDSDFFNKTANYRRAELIKVNMPTPREGADFHGQVVAGEFIINIFTYTATYLDASDVRTRYLPENRLVLVPSEGGEYEMAFGAVDQIYKDKGTKMGAARIIKGKADFYNWDEVSEGNLQWKVHTTSAPCCHPIRS